MSILIDKDTKVITQGITGKTGQFHTRMCRDYANGRNCFVAGVNPKKAGEDSLTLLDVRPFQPHHQRHLQIHFLRRGDDSVGDDVAAHDSAEDVDEDALHCGVAQNDLERRGDLLLVGAAADDLGDAAKKIVAEVKKAA